MIDNAILNHALGRSLEEAHEQMHFAHRQFPMGENKLLDNFDIVTNIGAFYYIITPLFAFLFIQN